MEKVFIALEEIRKASGPRRKYLALHIGVAASKPFFKVSWQNLQSAKSKAYIWK